MFDFLQECIREREDVMEELAALLTYGRYKGYNIRLEPSTGYEDSEEYGTNVWIDIVSRDDMGADKDIFFEELWQIADGVNDTSPIPAIVERNEIHNAEDAHAWTFILGSLGTIG